jgi:outer membrane murein-binding lipoprotein Lpp
MAVAGYQKETKVLRAKCDHLNSENAELASQVESMAMRIDSLSKELAKPEDVRLREVINALDGRAAIFDGLGARVEHLLNELDEWIERAGAAERRIEKAEEVVMLARQLTAYSWEDRLDDCEVSDAARQDSRELSIAVWLYDQEFKP